MQAGLFSSCALIVRLNSLDFYLIVYQQTAHDGSNGYKRDSVMVWEDIDLLWPYIILLQMNVMNVTV